MARTRKLFPTYGSALANNLLATLNRERVVSSFVADYVEEYDREGILGGPWRDRELAETIGREVVLASIVEVRRLLPGFFGKRRLAALKADEKEAIDAFLREMVAALGRAWNWSEEDHEQFLRDRTLYSDFALQQTAQEKLQKKRKRQQEEPPFVARVALLLDPSLIEQARRAAGKFHAEAGRFAQKLLRQTLRPRGR
jgi:hypothetical protein